MMLRNRYPDADILAQRAHWDSATRDVILDRVHNVPPFRFFDAAQRETLEALCAAIIPQDHRPPDRKVPIAPWIDARCDQKLIDGFRLETMPPNEVAWTWGLEGLDQSAQALFGRNFAELAADQRAEVLRMVAGGVPPGEIWQRLPARQWWIFTAARQVTGAYYAHPFAWDEIGFGGPAYPRGYASLNFGAPEPWEPREAPMETGQPAHALPKATPAPAARPREAQPEPLTVQPDRPAARWRSPSRPQRIATSTAEPTAPRSEQARDQEPQTLDASGGHHSEQRPRSVGGRAEAEAPGGEERETER